MDAPRSSKAYLTLALILIVAAGLRLYGLNWDQGQHAHPDERWIAMVAPTIVWPQRATDVLDPRRSTLNPLWTPDGRGGGEVRNFAYGHLPLYLQSLAGHALAALGRAMAGWGPGYRDLAYELTSYGQYEGITLVGRMLSVLSDLGVICLVYLMGRRIYGQVVGLLGAALVACAVMHVQLSHFSAFDVVTNLFIVLSLYGSLCVVQSRRQSVWSTIGAGAAAGLAVACKVNAAPLVGVLVFAQLLQAARTAQCHERTVGQLLRRSWPGIVTSLVAAMLAFLVTSPFAILDLRLYLRQIIEQGAMVRGQADWPFTRQYWNTVPFVYPIVQQVRWGLGWPLGIAAFAGFGWVIVRQFRHARAEELVLLGWAIPYFGLTGSFMVKFMRYMLPLLPVFILMGAAMLWEIRGSARRRLVEAGLHEPRSSVALALRCVQHLVPGVVLIATALYALAFMRVYSQTHPWIQASRWIYANLPDGTAIAREHWDDDLPLSLSGQANPGARGYDMSADLKLPMYEPDTPAKYQQVRSILRQADYVILATNRLYRTIPRMPERYPISTRFYSLLFEEKLGYVRDRDFTAYPGLGNWWLADDDADESFTVYDHPKPIVFRKVRDLDDQEWDRLFADALLKQAVWQPTKKVDLLGWTRRRPASESEAKRTLLLDRPVGDLPVVSDFGWNQWASGSTWGAVLIWWLLVLALGWLAWPLTFVIFRGLRDRGYMLSRLVALLVIGYLVWVPSSMHWLKNGLPLTYAAIAVLGVVSALVLWRHREEMVAFMDSHRMVLLLGEAVFGLAFLLFVGIRLLNPDLWQPWNGGEKLMDIAYLNSCLRSAYLPPYDPYYADGYLNYYYYGQFLLSIIARLTGIEATVAFNLAVPLLFALTVSAAFAIGYTLAGTWSRSGGNRSARFGIGHGLLTVLCVTVLGNLASMTQVVKRLGEVGKSTFASQLPGLQALVHAGSGVWQILFYGAQFPGFNYWDPSRVVGSTINEFPYWSFLFADLHPHMINIPFTLLVIALALSWMRRKPAQRWAGLPGQGRTPTTELALVLQSARGAWLRWDWGEVLTWGFWLLALGTLAAINTWDWPAYAGLCGLVLLFTWIRAWGKQGIVPALVAAAGLAGGSLLLYAPFFRYYTALYVGLGWSLGRGYTKLGEFLAVWGFLLFASATLLLVLLVRQRSRWALLRMLRLMIRYLARLPRLDELYALLVRKTRIGYRLSVVALIALILAVAYLAWRGYWVLALMVPLLGLAAVLLAQPRMPDGRRFVLALIFTSFLLLVGVEFFYLRDHLDGDQTGWWRMNTLFKFYLQVWVMLGVAVGATLPELWGAVQRWARGWRWAWQAAFGVLLASAACFVVLGTPARVVDRFPGERPPIGTLDGMAFMTVGTYSWPEAENRIPLWGDYEAIRWLRENVRGTPVLAEAPIGYYREFGVRVASFTGLPTLVGMHQSEQRYDWQVGPRSGTARELYVTADVQRTMAIIGELRIRYVYVGPLEKIEYPGAAAKFEQLARSNLLSVAYRNDLVTIYRVGQ